MPTIEFVDYRLPMRMNAKCCNKKNNAQCEWMEWRGKKMLRLGIEPRSTQPQCVILTTIRTEPRVSDGIKLIIPFFWCSSGVFWREGPSPTIQHPRSPCTSSFARIGDLTVCPPGFLIVRNSSLDFERRLKISRELFQIVALFI